MRNLTILPLILFIISCNPSGYHDGLNENRISQNYSENHQDSSGIILDKIEFLDPLTELQRGDILVKPNHNWIPGTSFVEGGSGFGHCVIVIQGAKGENTESVLKKTTIFESQARDVPEPYQLREIKAYAPGTDFRYATITFSQKQRGYRFRLRMNLTEQQKDSIISFVLQHDNDISSWRAPKWFPEDGKNNDREKHYWYCTLLIWQAFYHVMGIDLDSNQGLIIYPNDIINSSYFDDEKSLKQKRVRF